MLGLYTYLGGLFQDKILLVLLGYSGVEKGMDKKSIQVKTSFEKLKPIFLQQQVLDALHLVKKTRDETSVLRYRSSKMSDYNTFFEIKQIDSKISECLINVAVFERGRYDIRKNDQTEFYLALQLNTIEGVLRINKMEFQNGNELDVEPLINDVSLDLRGLSSHVEKLSPLSWIKVGVFISILGIVGWLFYDKGSTEGVIGVIVMFLLYIVYETRGFRERPSR